MSWHEFILVDALPSLLFRLMFNCYSEINVCDVKEFWLSLAILMVLKARDELMLSSIHDWKNG